VFLAALLNSQPMGFYAPAQLVADARRHGVEVRPVDVNHSDWDSTLERRGGDGAPAVRLGWSTVKGFARGVAETIARERRSGPFASFTDLVRRTGFTTAVLSRLASADGLRSLGLGRRPALWQSLAAADPGPLFADLPDAAPPPLPRAPAAQEVLDDYHAQRLSLRGHPFDPLRQSLAADRVVPAAELQTREAGKCYRVAGLVLARQRPETAKGVTFMTLEDETGTVNLIVWRQVWERFDGIARQARALIATGVLQREDGVVHLIVRDLKDLTAAVAGLGRTSRDFR
jgi:error-prone DNA polymerase